MSKKHTTEPSADWLKCIDTHIGTIAQLSKISAVYILICIAAIAWNVTWKWKQEKSGQSQFLKMFSSFFFSLKYIFYFYLKAAL